MVVILTVVGVKFICFCNQWIFISFCLESVGSLVRDIECNFCIDPIGSILGGGKISF